MNKVLSTEQAAGISKKLHQQGKQIVLAGGCFDLLHIGHITFLTKAKEQGNILILLLESDATIRNRKGEHRPINTQKDRATILAALQVVDYIVLLPSHLSNEHYDKLVIDIKPAIIATTKGDVHRFHKERQAKLIDARVVDVTPQVVDQSTTSLVRLLQEDL